MRIAHFVDCYPLLEHRYIYDQILNREGRNDRLLAGYALARQLPHVHYSVAVNRPFPVLRSIGW